MLSRGRTGAADSLSVTEIDRSGPPRLGAARPAPPVNGYENPTYQYYQAAEAAATGTEQVEAGKEQQ